MDSSPKHNRLLISVSHHDSDICNDSSEENGASHSHFFLPWEDNVVITLEYPDFSQLWNVDYTYEIHLNTKMQSEAKTFERITSDIVKLS